jgi:hypothetical protein
MLNFLAPAALGGLLLLAIPVAVHLFKPRKMRQTPFSSLRWLRMTRQRWSRRIRWHQLFLFALRAAFVVFLVLALSRPLWSPHAESKYTDRFVVVDVSRRMAFEAQGRPTPMARAKEMAAEIMTRARAGDRTALLLTGSTTRIVTPPTVDGQKFLPALQAVEAGATDTNLGSALSVIRPMLTHARPEADAEVYFITDNHQQGWSQGDIAAFAKDLPTPVKVHVVDVGVKGAANGWIADARLITTSGGSSTRRILHVDLGCVGDQAQERTVRIIGLSGAAEQERSVTLEPGLPTAVNFEVPAALDLRGQVAELRLEPADALPSDDRYFLNLDTTAALRVLMVEPDVPEEETIRPGLHLHTALESLAQGDRSLAVVRRTVSSATPRDFADADVIFLVGVPELLPQQLEAAETRVKAGAGLVVFLGPRLRHEFYNQKLFKAQQPGEGLLSVALKAEEPAQHGSTAPLSNIRWSHRLLAPLNDPVLGDLAGTRFRGYYRFAGSPPESDTVLAWIDDAVPAIVERGVGAGRVLLFNTTAGDDWSDLPRRKSFVPLVDRVLTYLSAGGARRDFPVGETVTLPLAEWKPGETLTVRGPSGAMIAPAFASAGGRNLLRLGPLMEAGVYRVERPDAAGKNFPFVVNVGTGDSMMTPADPATLESWFSPVALDVLDPEATAKQLARSTAEVTLWPWLVGFAGVVLIAEMFFVHWLCPKTNPALASVVVHRRGLFKPAPERR